MSTSKQGSWRDSKMTSTVLCLDYICFGSMDLHAANVSYSQETNNDHTKFEESPELLTMLAFLNELVYVKQIRLAGKFVIMDLPQPRQTLRKILMRYFTTRDMGVDQPSLYMMQMFYCIINK
ncbi:hypothetical protein Tco_1099405, partial [Tanacetum coccineum]